MVPPKTRRRAFVLGHPVAHSLSPVLHRVAYDFLGRQISYSSLDTREDQLADRFAFAARLGNVCGFSCTMPLKTAVKDFLDRQTGLARVVGTVNTVFWERSANGDRLQAVGHNTDVSGVVNSLNWAAAGEVDTGSCAIVGGGGTAAAALAAMTYLGAETVDVFVRSATRAHGVKTVAQRLGIRLRLKEFSSFADSAKNYSLTVSTLPAGAADSLCPRLAGKLSGILLDVSYDPWPSALAHRFHELGGVAVSGKEMLMYQAVDQVKLFTGYQLTDRLDGELAMVNAMCRSIGLSPRTVLPQNVYSARQLSPRDNR